MAGDKAMVDWLKGEVGGLMLAALGYVLREFSENHRTPARIFEAHGLRFVARFILALTAGILVLALLPPDVPNYARVAGLAFAGAATPEIVGLLVMRGLKRLDTATKDGTNG